MPLLLKPAPTRLRLVLWSLTNNIDEFPSAPPPGLVTVPTESFALSGVDTMSGYRNAGDRAIRVDMLERLADLLRSQDSKSGFECNSDMLSITGMTLEQFAGLMVGLGYKAEKGSRLKVVLENDNETQPSLSTVGEDELKGQDYPNEASKQETSEGETSDHNEVFYKFSWVSKKVNKSNKYSQKNGKPKKKKGKSLSVVRTKDVQTSFKNSGNKDKPIDPDNPFAKALMGFNRDT